MATATQETESAIIGAPINRVDGRAKVTGRARYAADFLGENLTYACAFQSQIANGRVKSIDAAEAKRMPGVIAIITHENAPRLHRVSMDHDPGKPGQTLLPLQDTTIFYAGQYLGMVVAHTFEQARDAAMTVKIDHDAQPPALSMEKALGEAYDPAKMGRGDKPSHDRGNPDRAFASAAVKIDQTFTTPVENHNPMELSATTAVWDGDKLTLYNATQFVYGCRSVVSTWLGIPEENVRVISPYLGGGFGCKGSSWPHEVMAAMAARLVKQPVKFVLSRSQMFNCVGYRSRTIQRVALGADQDGKLGSVIHECISQTAAYRDEWVEPATKQSRMLYSCANVRTTQKLVPINANTPTQMRAPGHATGTFALEAAMDELAYAAGVDPVELRLRNYAEKDEEEQLPWSSKALRECYRQGAQRFGWSKRDPRAGAMRAGGELVGYGMATATYPTNQQESSAKIEIRDDGSVVVSAAAHDLGTGAYTILSQVAADILGIDVGKIVVKLGDSDLPPAPVAGGSQTSASVGSAVKLTCQKALAALKERAGGDSASPLFLRQAKELAVENARVFVKADPAVGESISDLLKRNGGRSVAVLGSAVPPSRASEVENGTGNPQNPERFSKHAWGAQFVEIRIDPDLHRLRVERVVGAFAAGRILNAKTAHSQIMGGIVWGISMALFERTIHDPNRGQIVNDNLADYLLPTNADVPMIDCFFVEEIDNNVNPLGCKGIGELGITGVAAAISNAVFHATAKRVRDLPITLDKLFV